LCQNGRQQLEILSELIDELAEPASSPHDLCLEAEVTAFGADIEHVGYPDQMSDYIDESALSREQQIHADYQRADVQPASIEPVADTVKIGKSGI
jgi:hypothetical protein